ncbi:uncharacterized protein [Asterias amurensis]
MMSLVDLGKKLLEASRQGLEEEVKVLMANGAPFTTDWLGTSPLHLAAHAGHVSTAEVLLKAGVSRDARTKVDRTPLHLSAQEGHNELVQLLIQHGADVNAKDMLKMTPLHWAVERLHPGVVKLLLENGADYKLINKFDKSPIDIALEHRTPPIIRLFEAAQSAQGITDVADEEVPCIHISTADSTSSFSFTPTPAATALQSFVTAAAKAKLKDDQKVSTAVTTSTSSTCTSVLATLAALAEASTPLNKTGSVNRRSNSLYGKSGTTLQTYTLTEAGKLALNWKKSNSNEEKTRFIDSSDSSQTITIVQPSEGQAYMTSRPHSVGSLQPSQVSGSDSSQARLQLVADQIQKTKTNNPDDKMQQRLQAAQHQAEMYKQQLRAKEEEAENYRKKLQEISETKHAQNT